MITCLLNSEYAIWDKIQYSKIEKHGISTETEFLNSEVRTIYSSQNIHNLKVVSIVGGGGKTTTMFTLGRLLAQRGKRVAITTSTKIFHPNIIQCPCVILDEDKEKIKSALDKYKIVTVASPWKDGKLSSPTQGILEFLEKEADCLLIEADGAKCMPMKVPLEGEPVIYKGTQLIIAIVGMSALGKSMKDGCFRYGLAEKKYGLMSEHIINTDDIGDILFNSYYREDIPIIFSLNQVDNEQVYKNASKIADKLKKLGAKDIILTSFSSIINIK